MVNDAVALAGREEKRVGWNMWRGRGGGGIGVRRERGGEGEEEEEGKKGRAEDE